LKLKPLGKNVLIHPIDDPSMTESGLLYIPDQAKQRTDNGIVVAKGPDVTEDIQVADHVMFSGYSGDKVSIEDGGIFFLVPESHIHAKLVPGGVMLIDQDTAIRLIKERMGEIRQQGEYSRMENIEDALIDRIKMLTTSEGFLF
jgi:chaperonin GroES